MKILIIGIFDRKAQTYISFEPCPNKAVATRQFADAINRPGDNPFNKWPEDYSLWELGTFDNETGFVDPKTDEQGIFAKTLIIEAESLKKS